MNESKGSVLIVDDEFLIVMGLHYMAEEIGLNVCGTAATARDAVRIAQEHRPQIVLMDVRLKGKQDGVDAALAIHETVGCPVVFITGSKEPETIQRIHQDHPAFILIKPILLHQLRDAVSRILG